MNEFLSLTPCLNALKKNDNQNFQLNNELKRFNIFIDTYGKGNLEKLKERIFKDFFQTESEEIDIRRSFKSKTKKKKQRNIKKLFCIVDEAHHLVTNDATNNDNTSSNHKVNIFQEFITSLQNQVEVKLLLLTGTVIRHDVSEVIPLLNLISNPDDKLEVDLFNQNEEVWKGKFIEFVKGKVSFFRYNPSHDNPIDTVEVRPRFMINEEEEFANEEDPSDFFFPVFFFQGCLDNKRIIF